ncbi:MAG TPA: hypothetical protein VHA15_08505 [Burkholderiales bacterium]|nr:hypothetical protein [Burkholderiales bacterium]
MKVAIASIALLCLAGGAVQAAEGTGERVKSDAKAMAHDAKDAAVDVGRQIGQGSKKAYKSAKHKIKGDVNAGKPGTGANAARNEAQRTAKDGRE